MSSDKNRRRRANLYAVSPYCWYCGIRVYERALETGWQPDDQATLEHLVSRRNPLRCVEDIVMHHSRTVLACYACNNDRGAWTGLLAQAHQRDLDAQNRAWAPTIGQLVAMR